jgi:hypothetical protein
MLCVKWKFLIYIKMLLGGFQVWYHTRLNEGGKGTLGISEQELSYSQI